MSKKEIKYLIFNVPFCILLFLLLIIINLGFIYQYSEWNPGETATTSSTFLITLLIDLIITWLFKILNKRIVLFTLLELGVLYALIIIFL
jgi:hypothetical protein